MIAATTANRHTPPAPGPPNDAKKVRCSNPEPRGPVMPAAGRLTIALLAIPA